MKRRLAFALVGLVISFASPTLAQDPALKTYKQPATLRFEVFTCGAILGRSGHPRSRTCPKTGASTRTENRSSTTSYIGLPQLLRSSIRPQTMPHAFQFYFGIYY